MTIQLIPQRSTFNLPKDVSEFRFALSWCRDGGWGLSVRVKELRGMDLDLVVVPHTATGRVNGLFTPERSGPCDWLWHSHDEKNGGRTLWDESVLVDLDRVPDEVSMLTFAAVALKPGTSFNAVPRVTMDVYDTDGRPYVQSVTFLPDGLSDEPDESINTATVLKLVRAGEHWSAVRSDTLLAADTSDKVALAIALEETV